MAGAAISLFLVLMVLGVGWARTKKHAVIILASAAAIFVLLAGLIAVTLGSSRISQGISHNQPVSEVMSGSGRVEEWEALMRYCVDHPQGMGYIAGVRYYRIGRFAPGTPFDHQVGGTDNGYMEVLADAGWLALVTYAAMFARTAGLGWRIAKNHGFAHAAPSPDGFPALQCMLLVFLYCLLEQMENSDFVTPLRQCFYLQYILMAMILGASAGLSRQKNDNSQAGGGFTAAVGFSDPEPMRCAFLRIYGEPLQSFRRKAHHRSN